MYNSWESRTPIMGYNLRASWCPTIKRGLHTEMNSFPSFQPLTPIGGKCFTNPNFVNGNNPSLLRYQDLYQPVTTIKDPELVNNKSPVDTPQETTMKKKRKRKRRNRKRNKKTTIVKTDESPIPELTKSFENVSMESTKELAKDSFRMRVPSICESEDSFIVFEDRGGEDEESAIESDGIEESTEVSENDGTSSDSCIPHKKVRFADDKNLCEIHPMIQWSYAYQAARKGHWEECARDRERFSKRIREAENTLGSILNPLHREKIFNDRFNSM